jgi:Ni,Fe-hydrogenase maturation factor
VLRLKVAIIDGQGGGIGKRLIEKIKSTNLPLELIALGTNSLATSGMIKSGANVGATGENSIVVNADKIDVIMGPLAIIVPNSIMGEITPKMAHAIGNSRALKILIPISRCNVEIAGTKNVNMNDLLDYAVKELVSFYNTKKY